MVWYYPYEKREHDAIARTIRKGELHAAWMLTAYKTSDWQWCRPVGRTDEFAKRIERVRDCSDEEKQALNNLLWSAQICMRVVRVLEGNPWALACVD